MTIELRPMGVTCNLRCGYCYQNPQRDAGNLASSYDMAKMKAGIETAGGPFSLFGGEPLLIPLKDLEDLWSWGYSKYGRNSLQTNGSLITDAHIQLFKKYKVHVGISLDGPGELNDFRWAGSLEATRAATKRTEHALEILCNEGIAPSLIVTLHRKNATVDKIPIMVAWIKHLERMGIRSVRLHILEVENGMEREMFSLTTEENTAALLGFARLEKELTKLRLDLFKDMRSMLLGNDNQTTCVWKACDPYTTHAVQGVEGNGQRSNCGRTNKDGIDYVKSSEEGFERYVALYNTPQEHGGCQGCKFFLMCKGQCPGTAMDGDWRNRTEYCDVWKTLYQSLEDEMISQGITPISANLALRTQLERTIIAAWAGGKNPSIQSLKPKSSPARRLAAGVGSRLEETKLRTS